jgi:hypothetical protein
MIIQIYTYKHIDSTGGLVYRRQKNEETGEQSFPQSTAERDYVKGQRAARQVFVGEHAATQK